MVFVCRFGVILGLIFVELLFLLLFLLFVYYLSGGHIFTVVVLYFFLLLLGFWLWILLNMRLLFFSILLNFKSFTNNKLFLSISNLPWRIIISSPPFFSLNLTPLFHAIFRTYLPRSNISKLLILLKPPLFLLLFLNLLFIF